MKKEHTVAFTAIFFIFFAAALFFFIYTYVQLPLFLELAAGSGGAAFLFICVWLAFLRKTFRSDDTTVDDDNYANRVNKVLQNVTKKMRKQIYDLHSLFEVSINLTSILEPQQLIKSSILSLIGQLQTNQAIVFLPTKRDPTIVFPIYFKGFSKHQWKDFTLSLDDPLFQKFDKKMIAVNLLTVEEEFLNEKWNKLVDSGIILVAPIIPKKQIKGLIAVGQKMSQELFTRSEQEVFSLLAHFISVAFANSILYQKMEQISLTDELTTLYNYRYLKRRLENELLRARRYGHSLSLILFDVDHFKNYNDLQGHQAGDAALRLIAKILRSSTRKSDIPVRYGGEEFCVILPEESREGARLFAERLRQSIEAQPFQGEEDQPGGRLTISLGVSTFPEDADNIRDLIHQADTALYTAKNSGRNRTCVVPKKLKKRV
jgi:diguanylate cyclase (GGDEF)-like protein